MMLSFSLLQTGEKVMCSRGNLKITIIVNAQKNMTLENTHFCLPSIKSTPYWEIVLLMLMEKNLK